MINILKILGRWTMLASLATLAACGGGGSSGPTTTNDNIVATPSTTSPISVAVGSSATFSVTFTTDDGKTATNLAITSGLSTLPAGWSGVTSFNCASVSTGSGCMVSLTYAPTAAATGSVTLSYSYVNNAGTSKTGTTTVSYTATSNNSVVATPSPAGPIAVVVGGHMTVAVTFTTDDGLPATALSITGLSALPAGWTGPATFSCSSVSTGSGCVLNLTYAPSAIAPGTLALSFGYSNNSGTAKTGSISISYGATPQNHVIATPTPAGQIVAVIGGPGQTVKVDFTSDNSVSASNLTVTPASLNALPAGWTGPATFTCATVGTGNGCELSLTYAPTLAGSGTLVLNFGYTNNAGLAATGTVSISYMAGADNTVIATQSPSGTIGAVVGAGGSPVTVTFNSSDSNPVSNVTVTGGLSSLPAGWSSASGSTFTCASASNTGAGCQLSLTYNPTTVANGALQLNYSFQAHSGTTKTGSLTILFVATTHNILSTAQSPSGTIGAVVNSGSVPVTLTFTTNDGNPATAVTITSDMSTLPPGWSSAVTGTGTVICASASTGTGCQLALTYAPTVNGNGSLAIGYGYNDDSGSPQTGTANIAYASIPGSFYVTDLSSTVVRCAVSGVDGSLSSCASVATGFTATGAPTGIAFSGNWAYVTPTAVSTDVDVCPVNADGTFGACSSAQTFTSAAPNALAVSGGYLYVSDAANPSAYSCPINPDGSLGTCLTNPIGTVDTLADVAVTATNAYLVDYNGENLSTCAVSPTDGSLSGCTQATLIGTDPANTPHANPRSVSVYGGNLYIGTNAGVLVLPISGNGTVTLNYPCSTTPGTSCTSTPGPVQSTVYSFAFNNGYAYASGFGGGGGIGICTIETSGIVDNCTTSLSLVGNYGGMAVH